MFIRNVIFLTVNMSSKVVVIPYEQYLSLRNSHTEKDSLNTNKNQNIINSSDDTNNIDNTSIISVSNPHITQSQTKIDENKPLNDEIVDTVHVKDDNILTIEDILGLIPKSYHTKCSYLLNQLRSQNIHWDCLGRLVLGNDCILNTHIIDSLTDLIGINKKQEKKIPNSSVSLAQLLVKLNYPQYLLNNKLFKKQDENS